MTEAIGKDLRLANLLPPPSGRGLWVDASAPGALGQMPGLEDAASSVALVAAAADGVILNPGMAERLADRLPGKRGAGLMVRLDWTNAFRGDSYPLPVREVRQVRIGSAAQARLLGAEAVVMSLLLGYSEEFEAEGIERMAAVARECEALGLPLVVDVRPTGPRVRAENWAGVVQLGAGFAVEGGADAVVLPYPGDAGAWEMLRGWSPVPLLLRVGAPGDPAPDWPALTAPGGLLAQAGTGICVGEAVFAAPEREALLARLQGLAHGPQPGDQGVGG